MSQLKPKQATKFKSVEEIEVDITNASGIAQENIKTKRRNINFVVPRQIQMFLIRQETKMSHKDIAGLFGNKEHTRSIYASNCVNDMIFARDEKLYSIASKLPSYYYKYFFYIVDEVEKTLSMPIIKFPSLKVRG